MLDNHNETHAPILTDFENGKTVKVYPYILPNTNKSKTFMKQNAVTVAYITQTGFNPNDNSLATDENGIQYFEMTIDASILTKLDIASHTSIYGQELKEEAQIMGVSNNFPEKLEKSLNISGSIINPYVFVIGQPFDEEKYKNEELPVFIAASITEVKESDLNTSIDPEGYYKLDLRNIKDIETTFTNSRIIFQTKWDNKSLNNQYGLVDNGIKIGLEHHTLFGGIKAKGLTYETSELDLDTEIPVMNAASQNIKIPYEKVSEFLKDNTYADDVAFRMIVSLFIDPIDGTAPIVKNEEWLFERNDIQYSRNAAQDITEIILSSQISAPNIQYVTDTLEFKIILQDREAEYELIDLHSQEKMMPFKMTPIANQDKVSFLADWFDYDIVAPFYMINKAKAQDISISDLVTELADVNLIEDMLLISSGFASAWRGLPVITTGTETGRLDPSTYLGHNGIRITNVANRNPYEVIDGLFEEHIRKHPGIETDGKRSQQIKSTIALLSRYIYSSYAIGKGNNNYHQAYLPWYLELSAGKLIANSVTTKVTNQGLTGPAQIDSYLLLDGVKFTAKTIYFKDDYSSGISTRGNNQFILPSSINLSSPIAFQTDRKFTLPEVPDILPIMNKIPNPGDISTQTNDNLSYIWYLPVISDELFKKFMLDKETYTVNVEAGSIIDVQLQDGLLGKHITQEEANKRVSIRQEGTIVSPPVINQEEIFEGEILIIYDADLKFPRHAYVNYKGKYYDPIQLQTNPASPEPIERGVEKSFGFDPNTVRLVFKNNDANNENYHYYRMWWKYDKFSVSQVKTTKKEIHEVSYEKGREVIFDKEKWIRELPRMQIIPKGETKYHFKPAENVTIAEVDEIILTTVWGNYANIYFGSAVNQVFKIPLFNQDDETIAVQRIIFS